MATAGIVQKMVRALASAKRPTEPWCEGKITSSDIGLAIDGVGPVKLPLRPADVRKLQSVASQAPYGKRESTIVDTSVRDTLEINAAAVQYSEAFGEAIQAASRQVAEQLRLDADRLQVELYKLLIYPKGGFFLPHRDSEKRRGMVASMIVVLPSRFTGGELIVQQDGRRKVFDFAEARKQLHSQFAAFFADCKHEVKKVSSGVRVCLAFNLILKSQKSARSQAPDATADPELLLHVGNWLRHRSEDPIVFTLEHLYTEAGLQPNLLKGADKELYQQVVAVCDALDCRLHLGQVSRHLSQFADDGSFGYGYRGHRRWSGDYDDLAVGEAYEDEIVIDGWRDLHGKRIPMPVLACDSSQLISATPVEDWIPTRQEYEGYTGNAGNTLDRWYHKSALVVWPEKQHFDIVARTGLQFAVAQLLHMRQELLSTDDDELEQACNECQALAEGIIRHWPNRKNFQDYGDAGPPSWLREFIKELPKFDDPHLIGQFLRIVAARDWGVKLDEFVLTSLRRMGASDILPHLRDLIAFEPPPNQYGVRFLDGLAERDADWLLKLATDKTHGGLDEDQLQGLAAAAMRKLLAYARRFEAERYSRSASPVKAWLSLCKVAINSADGKLLESLLQLPRECPRTFDLRTVQVASAAKLRDYAQSRLGDIPPALGAWIEELRVWLRAATAEQPKPPATWARASVTDCNCNCCRQLREFLDNPDQEKTRIAARVDLRSHLEHVIRSKELDVTTKLIRSGSPHSLELTKTTASHQRNLKRYEADRQLLKLLQ